VVAVDTVTPGIDFALAPGGFIAGTIVNEDTDPVGSVSVSLFRKTR